MGAGLQEAALVHVSDSIVLLESSWKAPGRLADAVLLLVVSVEPAFSLFSCTLGV